MNTTAMTHTLIIHTGPHTDNRTYGDRQSLMVMANNLTGDNFRHPNRFGVYEDHGSYLSAMSEYLGFEIQDGTMVEVLEGEDMGQTLFTGTVGRQERKIA